MAHRLIKYDPTLFEHVVRVHSGAGNQLFNYAFGKGFELHSGRHVVYECDSVVPGYGHRSFCFDFFPNVEMDVVKWEDSVQKLPRVTLPCFGFDGFPEFDKPHFIGGCFQDERYFDSVANDLKSQLRFPPFINNEYVEDAVLKIKSVTNSVALHIRRGDYLSRGWDLPWSYYERAMQYMRGVLNNPVFFVFGTDLDYIRSHFGSVKDAVVIGSSHIGNVDDMWDMALIGECRHAIISNSTFAWWGAWLGKSNNGGIVVGPQPWINGIHGVVCDKWVHLGVDRDLIVIDEKTQESSAMDHRRYISYHRDDLAQTSCLCELADHTDNCILIPTHGPLPHTNVSNSCIALSELAAHWYVWHNKMYSKYVVFDHYHRHLKIGKWRPSIGEVQAFEVVDLSKIGRGSVLHHMRRYVGQLLIDATFKSIDRIYGKDNCYSKTLRTTKILVGRNMFMMNWSDFDALCDWLFGILGDVAAQVLPDKTSEFGTDKEWASTRIGNKRAMAFLGECLTSVWIECNMRYRLLSVDCSSVSKSNDPTIKKVQKIDFIGILGNPRYRDRALSCARRVERSVFCAKPRIFWNPPSLEMNIRANHCTEKFGYAMEPRWEMTYVIQHGHRKVLASGLDMGSERMLIMEDDVGILRDKRLINDIIDALPDDFDVALLDWICVSGEKYLSDTQRVNRYWSRLTYDASWPVRSAGMYIIKRNTAIKLLEIEDASSPDDIEDSREWMCRWKGAADYVWQILAKKPGINIYFSRPSVGRQIWDGRPKLTRRAIYERYGVDPEGMDVSNYDVE